MLLNEREEMNFRDPMIEIKQYMGLVRTWLWLIVSITVFSGALALLVLTQLPKVYQASTKVLVMEAAAAKTTDYNSILSSERLARTYADMMMTDVILDEVIERLSLPLSYTQLSEQVIVNPLRDTQLIKISVEGTSPKQTADIANMIVTVFIEKISSIQEMRYSETKENLQLQLKDTESRIEQLNQTVAVTTVLKDKEQLEAQIMQYQQIYTTLSTSYEQARLAEAASTANVVQVNTAQQPFEPIRPKVLLNTLLALLTGLVLSTGGVFLYDLLDDRLKTPEQVAQVTGLPVLGMIHEHAIEDRPITIREPRSPISESFRSLRTSIQYSNVDNPIRVLLITSPSPSEGKTLVSTNLSTVFAQGDKNVTLIDADLRRPTVHRRILISNIYGLSHLFVQPELSLSGALQKTKVERLSVISAGDLPPNPSELLGSNKMLSILAKVKETADMVVLDAPPILPVADASILANKVDGVLLVVRQGQTTAAAARQSVEQLQRVGAKILGVVINGINQKNSRYSYYYHNAESYYDSSSVPVAKIPAKREPVSRSLKSNGNSALSASAAKK
jgi:capsular exopolysaccharide synthesis family protein